MEKIQAGKYVELVYEILVVNGDEQVSVFKFNKEHPDAFVFGMDLSLIEGFQTNIMGLEQGAQFDFTLKPEEAFGVKSPDLIYELEKEILKDEGFYKTGGGVTFSGGEPFMQCEPLCELAQKCHQLGLNIMVYTGFTFEQLQAGFDQHPQWKELLENADILVDGKFVYKEKNNHISVPDGGC